MEAEVERRVTVMVKLTAQVGRRAAAAAAMRPVIDYAQTRPQTITYALFEDNDDSDVLWGFHLYEDREAFDIHRRSDALAATHDALEPCLARPFEVIRLSPIGGKGLPDRASAVSSCLSPDPRFGVLVRITAQHDKRSDLLDVMAPLREEAEREPGTLTYYSFADQTDPDVLWVFHLYADREAFEFHRRSATLKTTQAAMKPLLSQAYEVRKLSPIAGKGLPC